MMAIFLPLKKLVINAYMYWTRLKPCKYMQDIFLHTIFVCP